MCLHMLVMYWATDWNQTWAVCLLFINASRGKNRCATNQRWNTGEQVGSSKFRQRLSLIPWPVPGNLDYTTFDIYLVDGVVKWSKLPHTKKRFGLYDKMRTGGNICRLHEKWSWMAGRVWNTWKATPRRSVLATYRHTRSIFFTFENDLWRDFRLPCQPNPERTTGTSSVVIYLLVYVHSEWLWFLQLGLSQWNHNH